MGFLSDIAEKAPWAESKDAFTGKSGAEASRLAAAQTQANIERGLSEQMGFQRQAENQLQGGIGQNLGFLNQAMGQFGSAAGAFDPALANLQATGTASGRSSALADILADPNNARIFDELNRTSQNEMSGLGSRRSGFGIGQTQQGQLNLANQLLGQQDQSQQFLAGLGGNANANIANLLGQSGGVAGQGGVNMSNLIQQGSSNRMNLLGQLGQAGAAGTLGAANAQAQGAQNMGQAAVGIASLFSDERLKENIKRVGSTDSGLPVYTYNYKGDNMPQMGVMAQEALDKFPDAVSMHESGYMMVNYGGIS